LTKRYVASLLPEQRDYLVWDHTQKGLAVRVLPSGYKTWKFMYRHNRAVRWYHIGNVDIVSVRKIAQRVAGEAALGLDPRQRLLDRIDTDAERRNSEAAARSMARFVRDNDVNVDVDNNNTERPEPTVYFIKIGRAVKIGHTVHIDKRIKQLRHASAEPMILLACLSGGRELEKQIHRSLEDARIANEFFDERAVRSFLETIKRAVSDVADQRRRSWVG
jgi:hypothetical protein